jgi:hypothetical protein
MSKFLVLALFLSVSAYAEVQPGFTYNKQVKGKDARGEFNINYVLISPRAVRNDAIRRHVNAQMAASARSMLCEADRGNADKMSSNLATTVTHANADLLALRQGYDNYCMGAYPNHGTMSVLFDLRTGKQVEVENEAIDKNALKSLIVDKVLANKPAKDPSEGEEGCDSLYDREQLSQTGYEVGLKDAKLVVTQDYAHVAQACAYDTEISLSDVKSLLKPESILQRIVK